MSYLRTGRRVAQELGRVGVDRVRRRGGLPTQASALTAENLSRVLGREVTSVLALDGTTGTTDRSRLAVEGPGLPPSVFVKTAAVDTGTRIFGGMARLGEVEVGFYREVRPGLDLEAPQLIGASFDRGTGRFVIVLEDLAARDAVFCDTLTRLTTDQTAQVLSQLARLHGATSQRHADGVLARHQLRRRVPAADRRSPPPPGRQGGRAHARARGDGRRRPPARELPSLGLRARHGPAVRAARRPPPGQRVPVRRTVPGCSTGRRCAADTRSAT